MRRWKAVATMVSALVLSGTAGTRALAQASAIPSAQVPGTESAAAESQKGHELLTQMVAALGGDAMAHRHEVAVAHRLEALRERLLAEGDAALGELLQRHPQADRQHLRALIRQARGERAGQRPPHAYRELLRQLRALESAAAAAAAATDADADDATG